MRAIGNPGLTGRGEYLRISRFDSKVMPRMASRETIMPFPTSQIPRG